MIRIMVVLSLVSCASGLPEPKNPALDPTSPQAEEAPVGKIASLPEKDPVLSVAEPSPVHSGSAHGQQPSHEHGGGAAPPPKDRKPKPVKPADEGKKR